MASRGVPGSKSLIVSGSEGVSATTDRDRVHVYMLAVLHVKLHVYTQQMKLHSA